MGDARGVDDSEEVQLDAPRVETVQQADTATEHDVESAAATFVMVSPSSGVRQTTLHAAAVDAPWTPNAVGLPKSAFPAETMARVAAENIDSQIRGKDPTKEESFGDIPVVCNQLWPGRGLGNSPVGARGQEKGL